MKVVCGMSGGVDSGVSAALLLAQGYEVIGVTLKLWGDVTEEAQNIATQLGIPYYVVDSSSKFKKKVVNCFIKEYSKGRTPNTCVQCNENIKFEALLEKASELGAELIATGHYARIESNGKSFVLKKGKDANKEQSYFLARLSQKVLSKTLLPIGDYTKTKVKEMAKDMGFITKSESQEICFIKNDNYREFLCDEIPEKEGAIVDKNGEVLGKHKGFWGYTIGQRRGIGTPRDKPFYVTHINADENKIVVGDEEDLYSDNLIIDNLSWMSDFMTETTHESSIQVKIRYRHKPAWANITFQDKDAIVKFKEPQRAITPGQLAVFYQEEAVIGSGWIK